MGPKGNRNDGMTENQKQAEKKAQKQPLDPLNNPSFMILRSRQT